MSERCTIIQLHSGGIVVVKEPVAEVVAGVQDPGGAPLLELTRADGKGEDTLWIRAGSIAALWSAELISASEAAATWRAQIDQAASGKPLS